MVHILQDGKILADKALKGLKEKGLKEVTRLTRAGIGDNGYQNNGRLWGHLYEFSQDFSILAELGRCESGEE